MPTPLAFLCGASIQLSNQSNSLASAPVQDWQIVLPIFPQKIGGAAELGQRPCPRWILSRSPWNGKPADRGGLGRYGVFRRQPQSTNGMVLNSKTMLGCCSASVSVWLASFPFYNATRVSEPLI